MSLIKSIADSLFSPRELRQYHNKSAIRVILYILFLGILFLLPTAISNVDAGTLSQEEQMSIRSYFKNDVDEFPIEIIDGEMVCYDDGYTYSKQVTTSIAVFVGEEFSVANDALNQTSIIYISFLNDGVYVNNMLLSFQLFKYSDRAGFSNLKFDGAFADDSEFWNTIFKTYNDINEQIKPIIAIINVSIGFVQSLIALVLFSLLVTWFNRLGTIKILKFSRQWKITIYGMTAYVLGNILATMFQQSLMYYIGIIWSLVICIKSTQVYERGDNNEL